MVRIRAVVVEAGEAEIFDGQGAQPLGGVPRAHFAARDPLQQRIQLLTRLHALVVQVAPPPEPALVAPSSARGAQPSLR